MSSSGYKGAKLESIQKLREFTNQSEREAIKILKGANWDLEIALNMYYESQSFSYLEHDQTGCNVKEIQKMFGRYQDPDKKGWVTVEGTMQLCQDLGIEPTQLEFLLISHRLGSERMGEFEREKFVHGCIRLQCDTVEKLRAAIPKLRESLESVESFREIYNYAFLLGRQTGQKSLSLEAAVELWRLLLGDRFVYLEQWITFLEEKHGKAISRDTWNLFFDFAAQPVIDFNAHDSEGAWPILIDEFVEYMKERQT